MDGLETAPLFLGGRNLPDAAMESSKRGAGWTTWSFYFIRSPGPLTAYRGLLAATSRSLASKLGLNLGTVPEADMFPMSTQHVIDLKKKIKNAVIFISSLDARIREHRSAGEADR